MIAEIWFSEIAKIGYKSEISIIDFRPSKIAPQTVEVYKMPALRALVDAYVEQATQTNLCGRIYVRKKGRDRAIPGFNQMDPRGVLINKHVGEAAPDV
jgi:hypothetical protein